MSDEVETAWSFNGKILHKNKQNNTLEVRNETFKRATVFFVQYKSVKAQA